MPSAVDLKMDENPRDALADYALIFCTYISSHVSIGLVKTLKIEVSNTQQIHKLHCKKKFIPLQILEGPL